MRKIVILILTTVLIILLCSCQSQNVSEQNIPLLYIADSGKCYPYNWNTNSNSLTEIGEVLFENHEDPHTLMNTYWNGSDKYIIYDENTETFDNSITVSYRENRREFYYDNYTLIKNDDNTYILKYENADNTFTLDSNILVDGKPISEFGLSGFYVKDNLLYILLNTFSMEENNIKLYIYKFDYFSNNSENISEINNPPKTLSPASPPAGSNVISIDNSFIVFSTTQIYTINIENCTAETIFDVESAKTSGLSDSDEHGYLMKRMGFYNNKLIVYLVSDMQTAFETNYLCVVDNGKIIASIEVDKEYLMPNII